MFLYLDEISAYVLQAVGYSEDKAKKNTRLHDNNLKKEAIRTLLANKLSDVEVNNMIVFCSGLMRNEKYLKFHATYKKLYENDENFRKGCLAISKTVLASKDFFRQYER